MGMSFRSWRERKLLSQEKVAQMSGLSLGTVQRLEAGHRVIYASLRALAVTFEIEVDVLERELYAMKHSKEDFVEIPRWVRLLNDGRLAGLPSLSRRQAHKAEAFAIALGVVALVASFLVHPKSIASILRVAGVFALVCGYLQSLGNRANEFYKAWPETESSLAEWRPTRTLRGSIIQLAFVLLVTISFFAIVWWVAN
jgi:transcriptional regulator with XRE-family HTH domain